MVTDPVQVAYDANAELYASMFRGELAKDQQTLRMLAEFVTDASRLTGSVADLGCGPGDVVAHLVARGIDTFGLDLSRRQIEQARLAHPALRFRVGDLTALDIDDESLGGIVSRYSVIHQPPHQLGAVFSEWFRVLEPAAPLFVSFFGARSAHGHGEPFDHKVVRAHTLWPATIADLLIEAGFADVGIEVTPLPEGGRPFDHVTMLARTPPNERA